MKTTLRLALLLTLSCLPLLAEVYPQRVTIDPAGGNGEIKALHGICNFAPYTDTLGEGTNLVPEARKLQSPYAYFHDLPLNDAGMDIMDVSRVFPLFHADPDDPRNYRFTETDRYLQRVVDSNIKIIFRLGESIECHQPKLRVLPPPDFEKWADICIHIIRHYNEGWADGFHWDIQEWAIWEEPNNPNLWGADFERYLELYAVASRRIKQAFPQLKVGGPETTTLGLKYFDQFVQFCNHNHLPLDFTCFTAYFHTPEELLEGIRQRRQILDENGFELVPLWINELHLCPDWDTWEHPAQRLKAIADIDGAPGAAYLAAALAAMADAPVERACFYEFFGYGGWGLFNSKRDFNNPAPAYHVLDFYGQLYRECPERINVTLSRKTPGQYAIAGRGEDGAIRVILGLFSTEFQKITLPVPKGMRLESLRAIDGCGPDYRQLIPGGKELTANADGTVAFAKPGCPAAYFITLTPAEK